MIRLPTMSLDDFKSHVNNTGILEDSEARDLFTVIVGKQPNREIKFCNTERNLFFRNIYLTTTSIDNLPIHSSNGLYCRIEVQHLNFSEFLEISEVLFCHAPNCPIERVVAYSTADEPTKTDYIQESQESQCHGQPVYRAIFKDPLKVSKMVKMVFETAVDNASGVGSLIHGPKAHTYDINNRTITLVFNHYSEVEKGWDLIVGMKLKISPATFTFRLNSPNI